MHPKETERFCLRLALLYRKGSTSFEDLRTFNGITHSTFKETAQAMGYLDSDREWELCLTEAATHTVAFGQMRNLFCTILLQCQPSNVAALWENHKENLSLDILHQIRRIQNDNNITFSNSIFDLCLHLIDVQLKATGSSISEYELPQYELSEALYEQLERNDLLCDEMSYCIEDLQRELELNVCRMNDDQTRIFELINSNLENKNRGLHYDNVHFIDGPGGSTLK